MLANFVPEWSVIAAFTIAGLLLSWTPGPDMTLFLGRTLAQGRLAGIVSLLGASAGTLVHTFLAIVGISALIATSPTGFWVLKIVGALYLLWLAWQAIFVRSTFDVDSKKTQPLSLFRNFLFGVGVNLLNPKVILFYMTFLPQFVSATDPWASAKMVFLGLYFVVLTVPPMVILIFVADRFTVALKRKPVIARSIDYVFGTVFAAFAVRILFTQGR